MASGIFVLLDDIAALMDDVATVSKVATKKTAGLLADDLAVNAEKASGFLSSRELPVLWRLTKGSFLNKLIILPLIFVLTSFLPQVIVPLLLLGGAYLSFEGVLKIYEYFFHKKKEKSLSSDDSLSETEIVEHENKKVRSAIFIDFILSLEIVIIAIGTVMDQPLKVQIPAVIFIAILATIGVYGIVALLVRMDDLGLRLTSKGKSNTTQKVGRFLINALPIVIRALGVIGTIAMLLVGGGIFVHNLHFVHEIVHALPMALAELVVGLVAGILLFILYKLIYLLVKK